MAEILPFKIEIPDSAIEDLQRRLDAARFPEAEPLDDWSQGLPLNYARELTTYWREEYDWRAREAYLNRHPQFKTNIDGLDIHFVHCVSPHAGARPIALADGGLLLQRFQQDAVRVGQIW